MYKLQWEDGEEKELEQVDQCCMEFEAFLKIPAEASYRDISDGVIGCYESKTSTEVKAKIIRLTYDRKYFHDLLEKAMDNTPAGEFFMAKFIKYVYQSKSLEGWR